MPTIPLECIVPGLFVQLHPSGIRVVTIGEPEGRERIRLASACEAEGDGLACELIVVQITGELQRCILRAVVVVVAVAVAIVRAVGVALSAVTRI